MTLDEERRDRGTEKKKTKKKNTKNFIKGLTFKRKVVDRGRETSFSGILCGGC